MRHWRTSISGLVTALFSFVAFSPGLFARWPWAVELAKFFMVGGLATLGLTATDAKAAPPLPVVPPEIGAAVAEWAKKQQGLPSAQDLDQASAEKSIAKGTAS